LTANPTNGKWPNMATLKEMRKAAGVTMAQVAAAIGVSNVFVSNIEAGLSPLPAKYAETWARLINGPLEDVRAYEAVEVRLTGLRPSEKARVAAFVAEIRASRAA